MHKNIRSLLLIALSLLFAQTASAKVLSNSDIHSSFPGYNGDEDAVVYATRITSASNDATNSEMAVAYVDNNDKVRTQLYNSQRDEWLAGDILANDLMDGADSLQMEGLSVTAMRTYWVVSWISHHYNGETYVGSDYHIHALNRGGNQTDDGVVETSFDDLSEGMSGIEAGTLANADQAYLRIQPLSPNSNNTFYIFWSAGGELLTNIWIGPEAAWDGTEVSLGEIENAENVRVARDNQDPIYVATNESGIGVQKITRDSRLGSLGVEQTFTISEDENAELIDITDNGDGEVFVLYAENNIAYLRVIQNDTLLDRETVFAPNVGTLDATRMDAVFNAYGRGQYIIAWFHTANTNHIAKTRIWKPASGLTSAKRLGKTKVEGNFRFTGLQIRPYENGKIHFVWNKENRNDGKNIWYKKAYVPGDRGWLKTHKIKKQGVRGLREYMDLATSSQQKKQHIYVANVDSNQALYRASKLTASATQGTYVSLPANHEAVVQSTDSRSGYGNWYYLVTEKNNSLQVFMQREGELFQ